MANFLVSGGCGFIGREVVKRLMSAGHRVRVLDNLAYGQISGMAGAVELINGSVGDRTVLVSALDGVDRCIHLAGSPVLDCPRANRADHLEVFKNSADTFFDTAASAGIPVIYASSAAVYGEAANSPIAETTPCDPVNSHGMEKVALERAAASAAETTGLASMGLRMFNVYGAGQLPSSPYCGVVRLFADRVLRAEPVTVAGDGSQQRDFIYVDDAARAIVAAATREPKGADVINICSGVPVTVAQVIDQLERVAGRELEVVFNGLADAGVRLSVGLPDKAREILGFQASVPFDHGVALMMEALMNAPE
ncbi:NAD-dependent epimerase/dehydratase family protein [bacterium SCSIO 12827]|nr:NAD-dependent epimerase/dehydratase family protein [bacterium SCSIO 12827]